MGMTTMHTNTTTQWPQRLRLCLLAVSLVTLASCTTTPTDKAGFVRVAPAAGEQTASQAAARAEEAEQPEVPGRESAKIYKGTGVLVKPPAPEQPSKDRAEVSLNFEAVDVRDIAKTVLADVLGAGYIVDPKVQGTISFRSSRPLPRSALLPTLETVLRMNGIVMVKENDIFKIMPATEVRGSLSPKMGGSAAGYSIQVVPLKYIGSREMAAILEPFAPDPNAVRADELRNLVIIAGTQNEIRHMLDTIEMFDVDWLSGMSVGLFTLQSTDVKTIEAELAKIIGDPSLNPLAGVLRIIPMERLNGFVIITPQPHYLEQAKIWLERLDRAGGGGMGERLYVYHVQNGKAEHLADLLNQAFGGTTTTTRTTTAPSIAPGLAATTLRSSATTPGVAGTSTTRTGTTTTTQSTRRTAAATPQTMAGGTARGTTSARSSTRTATAPGAVSAGTLSVTTDTGVPEAEVRVVADPENNALLIVSTPAGYDKILSALKKLDIAPRQVLIEATLVEVALTDDLDFGSEWLFTRGSRKTGILDMTRETPGLNRLVPGFSYAITSASTGDIKAVLNVFAENGKAELLASPHIMVADNQTASIQVGQSVPVAGPQTITDSAVVSSVQYVETGVLLSVTPRINAGGLVTLEVNQEVSAAVETETSELNSPTISKRTAQTTVAVRSGETLVLGGLIRDDTSNGTAGLPLLSRIPILGGLFGTHTRTSRKVELVLLITPRVAESGEQARLISEEFRMKMRSAEQLLKCGSSPLPGYTTGGGLWCLNAPASVIEAPPAQTAPQTAPDRSKLPPAQM